MNSVDQSRAEIGAQRGGMRPGDEVAHSMAVTPSRILTGIQFLFDQSFTVWFPLQRASINSACHCWQPIVAK